MQVKCKTCGETLQKSELPTHDIKCIACNQCIPKGIKERENKLCKEHYSVIKQCLEKLNSPFTQLKFQEKDKQSLYFIGKWIDSSTKENLLHKSILKHDTNALKEFICLGCFDMNAKDKNGMTALHLAAEENYLEGVKILLQAGTSIDILDNQNRTPLHRGCFGGNIDIVNELIQKGACLELEDNEGNTALLLAVKNGKEQSVKCLLENTNPNIHACDKKGMSIIECIHKKDKAGIEMKNMIINHVLNNINQKSKEELKNNFELWKKEDKNRENMLNQHSSIWNLDDIPENMISKIKDKTYQITNGGVETLKSSHKSIYQALAYVGSMGCDTEDVIEVLKDYEKKMSEISSKSNYHALYFLVYSRLAFRSSKPKLSEILLRKFIEITNGNGEALSFLNEKEKNILSEDQHGNKKQKTIEEIWMKLLNESKNLNNLKQNQNIIIENEIDRKWKEISQYLNEDQKQPMEELLKLTGLDEVKQLAIEIYAGVLSDNNLSKHYKESVIPTVLNFAFIGNPGTGKSTVAQIFACLLEQSGARAGHRFLKMTAHEAIRKGSKAFATELGALTGGGRKIGPPPDPLRRFMKVEVNINGKWYPGEIINIPNNPSSGYTIKFTDGTEMEKVNKKYIRAQGSGQDIGGVLFLDEAYDLEPQSNIEGRAILAEIMSVAEEFRDSVTIIIAGYKEDIEKKLFSFNPGMASRFRMIPFKDFDESQLTNIWRNLCEKHNWICGEDICRVVGARVSRGCETKGFGNARDVRKLFHGAVTRARLRYLKPMKKMSKPKLEMIDVIGKEPTRKSIPELDKALNDLERMIGMKKVKEQLYELVRMAHVNYNHELRGEKVDHVLLNHLFLGNPGTGKTTIAKIYARILVSLGLLSGGDVIYRTASDFMGDVVGASANQTKAILELSQGNVLVIDEAYALNDDLYGKQVLDTIVEKVGGSPGEDIAVIMLGYSSPMLEMMRKQNPGLSRRFDVTNPWYFEDYTDEELLLLIAKRSKELGITIPLKVKLVIVKELAKLRSMPNFGNIGAANTLLNDAKRRMFDRIHRNSSNNDGNNYNLSRTMIIEDVLGKEDEDSAIIRENPISIFDKMEDVGDIKSRLKDLGDIVRISQKEGRPTNELIRHYIFTGDPGTGKTKTAQSMASILNAYGLIPRDYVHITSALDLTASYLGQTKVKVKEALESARGGVLFIDEAYELGNGSQYSTEALTTLLSSLTEDEYSNGNIVVILAGYKNQMHEMLNLNPGLKSRFTEYVHFPSWKAEQCKRLFFKKAKTAIPISIQINNDEYSLIENEISTFFDKLQNRPGWANARDSIRMFDDVNRERMKRMAKHDNALESITLNDVKLASINFLESRPDGDTQSSRISSQHENIDFASNINIPKKTMKRSKKKESKLSTIEEIEESIELDVKFDENEEMNIASERDDDVEDDVWEDLKRREQEELEREKKEELEKQEKERLLKQLEEDKRKAKEESERRRIEEEIRKEQERLEELRKKELEKKKIQEKLRRIGRCPANFQWIKVPGGYRCSAGGHFVSDSQINYL